MPETATYSGILTVTQNKIRKEYFRVVVFLNVKTISEYIKKSAKVLVCGVLFIWIMCGAVAIIFGSRYGSDYFIIILIIKVTPILTYQKNISVKIINTTLPI